MGKGYAEGPAGEERYEALERSERGERGREGGNAHERRAVYGATADNAEKHFIGWLDEVDPDELFASGKAWGLSIVRRREPG